MNKKFADTLKKLRTSKLISQHELAEKIFVTRSAIAKWENGYSLPDMLMIKRICKALEVNEYDLMKILLDGDDELNVIILKLLCKVHSPLSKKFCQTQIFLGLPNLSKQLNLPKKRKFR